MASPLHSPVAVTPPAEPDREVPACAQRWRAPAQLDAYGILAEIAHGGTSTVYLGQDRATGERVAIKALHACHVGHGELVDRLLGEHALARRVRHPGLLDIRGAGQTPQGVPYLVMELLEGESLAALASRGALPIETSVAIAAQVASALAALHAAGVAHCDLKPENVLVHHERSGALRTTVIDFGVARTAQDAALPEGTIVGTPAFMAPEQWHGAPTFKSDVYALGCVLYELVTGAPVFSGALPQLMRAHCEHLPARPSVRGAARDPSLGPALERLIIRALAKDPALRPSMADLEAELGRLAPGETGENLAGYLEAVG